MLKEGSSEFLDGIKISDIEKALKERGQEPVFHIISDCYNFDEILTILNES